MQESQESCGKCTGALDTEGYPKWCKACRAKYHREYQREYLNSKKQMTESKSFAEGVTAMRVYLAENFRRYGAAGFTGSEIAQTILTVKGPPVSA